MTGSKEKEDRRVKSKSDLNNQFFHEKAQKNDYLIDNPQKLGKCIVKSSKHVLGNGFDTFKLINSQMDTIKNEFIRLSEEIRNSTGQGDEDRSISKLKNSKEDYSQNNNYMRNSITPKSNSNQSNSFFLILRKYK